MMVRGKPAPLEGSAAAEAESVRGGALPLGCSGIVCDRPSLASWGSGGLVGADADFSGRLAAAAHAGTAIGAWVTATKAGMVMSAPEKVGGFELPRVMTRVPSVRTLRVRPDSGSMYAADTLTSEELISGASVHEW